MAATYALVLRGPDSRGGRLVLREELALQPGERTWALALESGRVVGEAARVSTDAFYEYRWSRSDGGREIEAIVRIRPDASGRFELPIVPAGSAEIVGSEPYEIEGRRYSRWETLVEFEVEPGETKAVRLP